MVTRESWRTPRNVFGGIVFANALAIGAMVLVQETLSGGARAVPLAAWGVIFAVVGVTYAILIGFLIAELLARFHRLRSLIDSELNEIEIIRDSLVQNPRQTLGFLVWRSAPWIDTD